MMIIPLINSPNR